ncbi:alpha/beta hydrolase [Alteromonas sp. ASW11-130]|uniref:alpha/beta hydrolase n=1 Tax=Alteromonas sp. ASW11-130 TaxID=3015775 RepID=UPI00224196A4|nr:alpha/beta hydrolase [Alteromonas sp. ASW11-130]MCW8092087.1 alpha/beta hydrolase [Alteromonas sp. ASW11-130]
MFQQFVLIIFILLFNSSSYGGEIFESFPKNIKSSDSYVFYSHGFIVEGTDPTPIHERWGKYNFPAVKKGLADPSYHLIATHRPAKTHPFQYAEQLSKQVNQLLKNGVPASNISLVGFSRGGFITAITSSNLKNMDINFVILAACTSSLAKREEIAIYGHLFSVYETSDSVGSCDDVVARRRDTVSSYEEISISTGKEHGAFFLPRNEWIVPVKSWLKRRKLK